MAMTYVLDASALIRFFEKDIGAEQVNARIKQRLRGEILLKMTPIQFGEVVAVMLRRHGREGLERALEQMDGFLMDIDPVDAAAAMRAGLMRERTGLSYADCFAAELTSREKGSVLITSDFGFKKLAPEIEIEFLGAKQ